MGIVPIAKLFSLLFSRFKPRGNRILSFWSERGYHIYLYQSVVFTIVDVLRQHTFIGATSSLLARALIDAAIVFGLSMALAMLTYPLERAIMRKI